MLSAIVHYFLYHMGRNSVQKKNSNFKKVNLLMKRNIDVLKFISAMPISLQNKQFEINSGSIKQRQFMCANLRYKRYSLVSRNNTCNFSKRKNKVCIVSYNCYFVHVRSSCYFMDCYKTCLVLKPFHKRFSRVPGSLIW